MALIFFFLINIDSAHTVAEMTAQTLPLFTTNRLQSGPKLTLTAHSYKKKLSYHRIISISIFCILGPFLFLFVLSTPF